MDNFSYLAEKIRHAKLVNEPFPHIYIENFFATDDFARLIEAPEINLAPVADDKALFERLAQHDYQILHFPGCTTSVKDYLAWHKDKKHGRHYNNSACEGFGMTMRLGEAKTGVVAEIQAYLQSTEFNQALAEKFAIDLSECTIDSGIQKYLDGYEISPHPDVRKKALTFMVNLNPHDNSEELVHHTHYLRFKPAYRYVSEFWRQNENIERCWVPWSWCESVALQRKNNSIVVFAPTEDTLHAVKADYNHLVAQRTQLYGNFWYKKGGKGVTDKEKREWEQIDIVNGVLPPQLSFQQRLKQLIPTPVKDVVNRLRGRSGNPVTHRNY